MKNKFKTPIISLILILISLQQVYAEPRIDIDNSLTKVESLFEIQNGVLKYTEISKISLNELTVDLNQGLIQISKTRNFGKINHTSTYKLESFKFDKSLLNTNIELSRNDTKSLFVEQNTKSCGSAMSLMGMANDMISEGRTTNNDALVAWGNMLLSMAMAQIVAECHPF
jgi:predicted DNA-binding WGR domain protein